MTRTKRGSIAKKRRKKIYNISEGFRGSHSKLFATANQQVMKSLRYSYFDRRKRKNFFKRLWIQRINAATRACGKNYSLLLKHLKLSKVLINKKILSKICVVDMNLFKKIDNL
jgi:large subunit ribosomal protein L20